MQSGADVHVVGALRPIEKRADFFLSGHVIGVRSRIPPPAVLLLKKSVIARYSGQWPSGRIRRAVHFAPEPGLADEFRGPLQQTRRCELRGVYATAHFTYATRSSM